MLRWIVLLVLAWAITGGYFLVSIEFAIWSTTFGKGESTANPVAQIELQRGQPFGLSAHRDEYVKCQVVPRAGETREFIPDRPANSLRSSRLPGPEPAWFSGPAEVRCTGPTSVILPDRYDKTGLNVGYVLMGLSSLLLLVVMVQIWRRVRFGNARYRTD